jgi:hypothetical protein
MLMQKKKDPQKINGDCDDNIMWLKYEEIANILKNQLVLAVTKFDYPHQEQSRWEISLLGRSLMA